MENKGDLISRKALYDKIAELEEDVRKTIVHQPKGSPEYLRCQSRLNELNEFKSEVRNAPSVTDTNVGGKWILCSEKLPDIKEGKYASDCVLVTLKWFDGEISETVGWYNRTGTWSEGGAMSKVIAWMPYEPYKGE